MHNVPVLADGLDVALGLYRTAELPYMTQWTRGGLAREVGAFHCWVAFIAIILPFLPAG